MHRQKFFVLFILLGCVWALAACNVSPAPSPTISPGISATPEATVEPQPPPEPTPMIEMLRLDAPFRLDVNADGAADTFYITEIEENDDGRAYINLNVDFNDGALELTLTEGYPVAAYVYAMNDRAAIILSVDYMSDDYETLLYVFHEDNTIERAGEIPGYVDNAEPNVLDVVRFIDALGTWRVRSQYEISENFMFAPLEIPAAYAIEEEDRALVVARELPCYIQAGNSGAFELTAVEAGTVLHPHSIVPDESKFIFTLDNDAMGYIIFVRNENGESLISGLHDYEWFEEVHYYG